MAPTSSLPVIPVGVSVKRVGAPWTTSVVFQGCPVDR